MVYFYEIPDRRLHMRYINFLIVILCIFTEAMAYPMHQPLTEENRKKTHAVFIGKAVAYKSLPAPDPVQITFHIKKGISGHQYLGDENTANWIHGTFGEPESLEDFRHIYGDRTKTAILFPQIFPEKCKMVESVNGLGKSLGIRESCQSSFTVNGKSKNVWVLNKYCPGL